MNQFQQHFLPILQQHQQPILQQPILPQPIPQQPIPQLNPVPQPQHDPLAFEWIRGARGNSRQLLYYGHRYTKSGSNGDTQYLRCVHHKRHARINPLPCRSILHYSNGEVVRQPSLHNHHSEDEKNTVKSVLSTIKTASSSSRVAPSLVVANATGGLSAAERLMLPSDRAMKKVSQRAYQREHPNQRAPPTLSDLVLTNDDLLNSNQQPMLIYDNHHATRRTIVLGSAEGYQALSVAQHWASDCTFKSSPRLTTQVSDHLFKLHFIFQD